MTMFLAGLALGVAGAAHCVAMCGPLLAALAPRGWRAVIHHSSRTMTYVLLGALAGLAGMGAAVAGFGRPLAWLAACCLVIQAVVPVITVRQHQGWAGRAVTHAVALTRALSQRHPGLASVILGSLNALLPCGLVYSAIIAAVGFGDVVTGAWFMLGFASGTTLTLTAASALWSVVVGNLPGRRQRLAPIALAAVALLLLWRGWAGSGPSLHIH
jgi:uncharacterized protein